MNSITDLLSAGYPPTRSFWFWLSLVALFFLLELCTGSQLFFLCLATAALMTAGGTALFASLQQDFNSQLLLFGASTGFSLLLWYRFFFSVNRKQAGESGNTLLNNPLQRLIGGVYPLLEVTQFNQGTIRVGDTRWQVEFQHVPETPLQPGTLVKVIELREGAILVVPAS